MWDVNHGTIVGTSSPKAAHTGGGGGRGGAVMTAVNRWHAATRSDGAINQACSQVAGTFRMPIPCVSTPVPLTLIDPLYTSIIYFITYLIDNFKSWEKSCEI